MVRTQGLLQTVMRTMVTTVDSHQECTGFDEKAHERTLAVHTEESPMPNVARTTDKPIVFMIAPKQVKASSKSEEHKKKPYSKAKNSPSNGKPASTSSASTEANLLKKIQKLNTK